MNHDIEDFEYGSPRESFLEYLDYPQEPIWNTEILALEVAREGHSGKSYLRKLEILTGGPITQWKLKLED